MRLLRGRITFSEETITTIVPIATKTNEPATVIYIPSLKKPTEQQRLEWKVGQQILVVGQACILNAGRSIDFQLVEYPLKGKTEEVARVGGNKEAENSALD